MSGKITPGSAHTSRSIFCNLCPGWSSEWVSCWFQPCFSLLKIGHTQYALCYSSALGYWWLKPFKHWNWHLILLNIGISILSFQTLEFAPYPFKDWIRTLNLSNIRICALSFQRLDSHLKPFEHWNLHLILLNIGIRILYFQTLEFAPYPFKDWIRTLNLSNIGIGILSF